MSSLVATYTTYFATYSRGNTNVIQLVPGKVWKLVYDQFLCKHPGSKFAEETLKDKLWKILKKLKRGTLNEGESDKAILQPDEVLTHLRNMVSHVMHNILRLWHTMLDQTSSGGGNSPSTFWQPSLLGMVPSQVQDAPLGLQPSTHRGGTYSWSSSSTKSFHQK